MAWLDTDLRDRLYQEFVVIAERYNCPGWVEIQLWKSLGKMSLKPFFSLQFLSEEELEILGMLRDMGCWVSWIGNQWTMINIEDWKNLFEHATSSTNLQT